MNALFVPLALEAFITNDENRAEKQIADVSPDYTRLEGDSHLGGKLEPRPFESREQLEAGVHLHFILPDALTHAVTASDGSLKYPQIPNRWLVTRLTAEKRLAAKSWLVESDYLGLDNEKSITVPYLTDKETPYRRLGRCYSVDQPPAGGTFLSELTAVGAGDAAFAAYYPSCRSVLGFHDPLEGVDAADITYFVMGFYSHPEKDPLYHLTPEEYRLYLAENKWAVPKEAPVASKLICHGLVHTLPWRGPSANYPSGAPTGAVDGAVGNTSVEALSALISYKLKEKNKINDDCTLERFLAAMQYDLLDDMDGVDGIAATEELLHTNEFEPVSGGTHWDIRADENTGREERPSVPEGTGRLLSLLNDAQSREDSLTRKKMWLQKALFSVWYTYVDLIEDPPPPWKKPKPSKEDMEREINRLCGLTDRLEKEVEDAKKAVTAAKGAVEKHIGIKGGRKDQKRETEKGLKLEATEGERFWKPREPVVLLAGAGIDRPYAYGQDGILDCRTETVNGLSDGKVRLSKEAILAYCDYSSKTPGEFLDMLCEGICLSPVAVKWIEKAAAAANLAPVGTKPMSVACYPWKQPWITLFIEWKVKYTPTGTAADKDNSMEGWRFADIDYEYEKTLTGASSVYTGRTVLTPHSTLLLKKTLEKKIEKYKEDEKLYRKLKKALDMVENLAVVSQQLDGFRWQLLSLRQTLQLPIMEEEGSVTLSKEVAEKLRGASLLSVVPTSPFLPIRAGFLEIQQVNVVSSFGFRQLLASSLVQTVFSEQLSGEHGGNGGMLPPRLGQGARLRFDWVSRNDDSVVSCIDPETSPVCGYFYPDILNYNMMVYQADGTFKGTIRLVYRNGKPEARWVSGPGEPRDFNNVRFDCKHLKEAVASILKYSSQRDPAFYGLMKMIDQRLDASCACAPGDDLSLLWGRPLALTRGRMSLRLWGEPAYSLAAEDFGKYRTKDFNQIKLPVFLGDISRIMDGAVGFYPDGKNQYDGMHCVPGVAKVSVKTEYLRYNEPMLLACGDEKDTYVTVLMEAGASVSLRTGLLPAVQTPILAAAWQEGLSCLHLSFEVNPILSGFEEIALPVPEERDIDWNWYFLQDGKFVEKGKVVSPEPVFGKENPVLIDGYLKRKESKA